MSTTTVKATISIHVISSSREKAEDAASNFLSVLNRVWIASPARLTDVGPEVYFVAVYVEAPEFELNPDAPILREALVATGLPTDTLRISR